jgi:hypothetical protein
LDERLHWSDSVCKVEQVLELASGDHCLDITYVYIASEFCLDLGKGGLRCALKEEDRGGVVKKRVANRELYFVQLSRLGTLGAVLVRVEPLVLHEVHRDVAHREALVAQ